MEQQNSTGKPPLSIIIPTFNEELYVGKLLTSLSKQTFKNFEVLVVDGHSDDETVKVCAESKVILPQLIILKAEQRGVSSQRNFGARAARADIFLFLDADVILPTDFLERSFKEFIEKKADTATCLSWPLSQNIIDWFLFVPLNFIVRILHLLNGWTIFSKRSLHQEINGFAEDIFYFEDGDYSLRARRKKAKVIMIRKVASSVSVRRFNYEGRLHLLKKLAIFYFYWLFHGTKASQKKIVWETGIFGKLEK